MSAATIIGVDGVERCAWAHAQPEYLGYHDDEWGRPMHGDLALFEKLSLEAFQSGLSWITILRKRDAFRDAFAGFDIATVAAFDEADVERLLGDAQIIRNRSKILATISNARVTHELVRDQPGAFDELLWSFAPPPRPVAPVSLESLPPTTPESDRASRELKRRGYKFVGPTTVYSLMQFVGMVNDHAAGCFRAIG